MPETIDHVAYLSQQIGPRPAGTEEEQQAALYITEHLQKEAGLSAVIEDFNNASGHDAARALCCVVTIVITALSLFLPVLAIPSMVLAIIAAALFVLETLDRPLLSRLFPKGVSQNVVAKYEPGYAPDGTGARRRKVVVVARYDSGKVQTKLNGPLVGVLPILRLVVAGAMVFVPLLLIVRYVFFLHATGPVAVVFNALTVVALVIVALPVVDVLMCKVAAYNEGANCNAAGVAVLMDVATRIGRGRVSEDELSARRAEFDPTVHGEDAARAAGLVPEGAQLVYEAAAMQPPDLAPQTPEARLAAAKAAVAALSGKPVSSTPTSDIAGRLVQVKEPPLPESTPENLREMRGETREAFGDIPAGTVQDALARAASGGEVGGDAGVAAAGAGMGNGAAGAGESGWFGGAPEAAGQNAAAQNLAAAGADGVAAPAADGAAPAAAGGFAAGAVAGAVGMATSGASAASDGGVPDWFRKAQQKAKKPHDDGAPVQRSRYADALDAAAAAAAPEEPARDMAWETEQRLQQVRAAIMETKAAKEQREDRAAGVAEAAFGQGAEGTAAAGAGVPAAGAASGVPASGFPADAPVSDSARPSAPAALPAEPLDGSTQAMPPLDIDALRAETLPAQPSVGVPAFLQDYPAAAAAGGASEAHPAPDAVAPDAAARAVVAGSLGDSPASETAAVVVADAGAPAARRRPSKRRPITLPDIGGAPAPVLPEVQKQRAPLADVEESGKAAAKSLLTMLPSIDLAAPDAASAQAAAGETGADAGAKGPLAGLRSSLPSLSGAIAARGASAGGVGGPDATSASTAPAPSAAVAHPGAFVPGATGAFAPVGEELLQNVDPDDLYVDDADDSDYEGNVTETGAFAGPGYVEMPKSRAQRLLSKLHFGKKKRQEESTPQEWLDVDESFDARSVGAARGGWESFRNDEDAPAAAAALAPQAAAAAEGAYGEGAFGDGQGAHGGRDAGNAYGSHGGHDAYGAYDAYDDQGFASEEWDGFQDAQDASPADGYEYGFASAGFDEPAAPAAIDAPAPAAATGSAAPAPAAAQPVFAADDTLTNLPVEDIRERLQAEESDQNESARRARGRRRWNGGAFSRRMMRQAEEAEGLVEDGFEGERRSQPLPGMDASGELGQIHRFRHPDIDTEVWFVALGAELAQNAGMRAFLAEHAQDLRGSIIVELDGLGAGDLSLVEREGTYRTVAASSRMKRYVRKASQAMGMQVPSATLRLNESAASFATKQGYQAMHLAGMDGAKPAYFAQGDDVLENIDEEKLLQNSDFVMELLKNI